MLAELVKKNHFAAILKRVAVVVMKDDKEIMFHGNEKDAGAWVQHVYGLRPSEARKGNIVIRSIADRAPRPGDVVVYDGSGPFDTYQKQNNGGGLGVLECHAGGLMVCFAASAFREHSRVSCSGGPATWLKSEHLTFEGLIDRSFWRWGRGFSGSGEGGHYTITVPLWRWDGVADLDLD